MADEVEAGALGSLAGFLRRRREHALPVGEPCANCGTILQGPFCHTCGQGSDNHKRSITRLSWEAFKDFSSWDGRFLRTIPALFFRPGKLARDFLEGRIARHVPAFRLFLIALVVFIFSAEHLVDRFANALSQEEQRQIALLSTPEGRAKEADRVRARAAMERDQELKEAGDARAQDLEKGVDPAKVEAAYQAEAARAHAEFDKSVKRAEAILSGRSGPISFGADLKVGAATRQQITLEAGDKSGRLQRGFDAALANPDYYLVVLFSWGQRLAILWLPILALALGLACATKRRYFLFDHLIVAMNLLSFVFLTNAFGFWLPWMLWGWWCWLLVVWTPVNLFQTLRGAYGSSILGASLKSLFLWAVNGIVFTALIIGTALYASWQLG